MSLNIYDLDAQNVISFLNRNGILAVASGVQAKALTHVEKAQRLVDQLYFGVSDLVPVQFHYMLVKSSLDDAINPMLEALRLEDFEKYARYKAYLNGARHYEFSKALSMYLDIKTKLIGIDPNLDFTVEQLKTMWLEASKV